MSSEFDDLEALVMQDAREIYSETAIDHAMNPRNVGSITDEDGFGAVTGSCGDTVEIWLKVKNEMIQNATFWTDGCGATIATGSMITEMAKGKSVVEVQRITKQELLDALVRAGQGYDLSALAVSFGGEAAAAAPALPLKGDAEPLPPSSEELDLTEPAPVAEDDRLRAMAKAIVAGLATFWAALLPFLKRLMPDRTDLQPSTWRQSTAVKSKDTPKKRPTAKPAGHGAARLA